MAGTILGVMLNVDCGVSRVISPRISIAAAWLSIRGGEAASARLRRRATLHDLRRGSVRSPARDDMDPHVPQAMLWTSAPQADAHLSDAHAKLLATMSKLHQVRFTGLFPRFPCASSLHPVCRAALCFLFEFPCFPLSPARGAKQTMICSEPRRSLLRRQQWRAQAATVRTNTVMIMHIPHLVLGTSGTGTAGTMSISPCPNLRCHTSTLSLTRSTLSESSSCLRVSWPCCQQ